jgi:hypothetical protein
LARGGAFWVRDTLTPGLATLNPKMRAGTIAAVKRQSARSEGYMKRSAPWHDRTGAARGSLNAHSEHSATTDTLILAHGVEYGFWLEVIEGGEYSIVIPATPVAGDELMQTLNKLFAVL